LEETTGCPWRKVTIETKIPKKREFFIGKSFYFRQKL
jgi:hypothetical protein